MRLKTIHSNFFLGVMGGLLLLASILSAQIRQPSDLHYANGLEAQKAGKLEKAAAEYEQSVKVQPTVPALANLGSVYSQLGRYEDAIAKYHQALKLVPGQPMVIYNLGLAYYKASNFPAAVEQFSAIVRKEPDYLNARILLADSLFRLGDFKKVIALMEKPANDKPKDLSIAYILGHAYLMDHQTDKGQAMINRILGQGETAEGHLMMGLLLASIYHSKEAVAEFERAIQLNPNVPYAHAGIAAEILKQADFDRALAEYEAEAKVNPSDYTAHFYIGFLHRMNKEFEPAMQALRKALSLRPGDGGALLQIAMIHQLRGELDESQKILEELVKRDPEFLEAHETLARVYYRKKMIPEGEREQKIAETIQAKLQAEKSKQDESKKAVMDVK
jgi:tetratricopeptide (TPR) repeat protein